MKIRWRMLAAGVLLMGLAGAAGVGLGVELHRRWPIESVERPLERFSIAVRPMDPWRFRARIPAPRFEPAAAVADGKLYVMGGFYNTAIQATTRVDVFDPATNAWSQLGDLPAATTHATPALRNGELWIAGGFVGDNPGPATSAVWRYDPRTDQWSSGPDLPESRASGALVALPDGALHYFGGWMADRKTEAANHWRLGASDTIWTQVAPFPNPRGHHAAVAVGGAIYAIGGAIGHDPVSVDVADVHRYDPVTDAWSEVAPLPEPLSHMEPGTFALDGRIYVAGGRSFPRGKPSVQEVVVYDTATDTWSYLAHLPRALFAPAAVPLDGELFVTAGGEGGTNPRNVQSWSMPLGPAWRPAPAMPVSLGEVAGGLIGSTLILVGEGHRATLAFDVGRGVWEPTGARMARPVWGHHHAAEVIDGELYLVGGLTRVSLPQVQVYNPATDAWRFGPELPYPVGSAASSVIDGKLYLAGGIVGDTTTRGALVLDPGSLVWRPIAPMPRARNHAASATDGQRFYVFGGRGPGSGDANVVANGYDDVQIYDPITDTWVASGDGPGSPAPVPQARGGMGKAVFLGGEFYVLGGETLDGAGASDRGVYGRVDIYDPVSNTWRAGPPLQVPRHGVFPVAHGPGIWVAGGGVQSAGSTSGVVEFLLPAR